MWCGCIECTFPFFLLEGGDMERVSIRMFGISEWTSETRGSVSGRELGCGIFVRGECGNAVASHVFHIGTAFYRLGLFFQL